MLVVVVVVVVVVVDGGVAVVVVVVGGVVVVVVEEVVVDEVVVDEVVVDVLVEVLVGRGGCVVLRTGGGTYVGWVVTPACGRYLTLPGGGSWRTG